MPKQHIPTQEDLPLILAWIKPCHDPSQGCERARCKRMADFAIDEYEDRGVIEEAIKKSNLIILSELEDTLWQHTVQEQMQNSFTVYQVVYFCQECLLGLLKAFLNTSKEKELREMLTTCKARNDFSIVQWHFLSYPERGLCTPTKVSTPQAFLDWVKTGIQVEWKVRE
jgi:hypothetical protein